MISHAEFAQALRGTMRLARLDAGGLNDFNATVEGFWHSFAAALLVAPGYAILIGPGIAQLPMDTAIRQTLAEVIAYVINWAAFPLVMHEVVARIGRDSAYIRFIVAHNWSVVLQMLVLLTAVLAGAALPAGTAVFLHMLGFGFILFNQWFIARTALSVRGGTAAACVALGILIELISSYAATLVGTGALPAAGQ